jgi:hypothetical protein
MNRYLRSTDRAFPDLLEVEHLALAAVGVVILILAEKTRFLPQIK